MLAGVSGADPARPERLATDYYSINKLHAPCCAVMLKHALTNVSGVVSAEIFTTNQVVRIRHRPGKEVLKDINRAFRSEIVQARRLKEAPKGPLR